MIYSPKQARVLYDIWPKNATQFIVGGPANAYEAQIITQKFKGVQCFGFEPNPNMLKAQTELKFPGTLYPYALWNKDEELILSTPVTTDKNPRDISSSVVRDFEDCLLNKVTVRGRTLDSLSDELGPFENCVLWIDIEQAELQALQGAKNLLESRKILMINLEVMNGEEEEIISLLDSYNLRLLKRWGHRRIINNLFAEDIIFVLS